MSAARHLARAAAAAHAPTPPGGVDLSHVKGGDPVVQRQRADEMLHQNGFVCSCGERFRDKAIIAMGYVLGRFPQQQTIQTPQGPQIANVMDDGAMMLQAGFCSTQCPDFLRALQDGLPVPDGMRRPPVMAIRDLPATVWADDIPEAERKAG
jgi:hypothetical protein